MPCEGSAAHPWPQVRRSAAGQKQRLRPTSCPGNVASCGAE